MEAVPVELGHPAYVPLVHLLVAPAAPHRHPGLDVVPDVEGVVVVGLEVRPPLEGLWRGDAGRTQHPLTSAASVNILKSG